MKLIVGGIDSVPGFATMDLNSGADYVADIRLRWPFRDDSIEVVFSSHVIEHITRAEALFAMRECYRVMKPGGILRISTPDLELFARKYIEHDIGFYGQSVDGRKARFVGETMADKFMYVTHGMGHRWLYDIESLNHLLEQCGFVSVERKNYRESVVPDVDLLDNRPDVSLFVEASKGVTPRDAGQKHSKSVLSWYSSMFIRIRLLLSLVKSKALWIVGTRRP